MTGPLPPRTVVVLTGVTASGKTALGEALASHWDGVVVCADARQVFAELDVGTGKPTRIERGSRPHALFEWRRLGEPVSAGAWARAAAAVCESAFAESRTPVLVGGSGLYVRALVEGLHGTPARDAAIRATLEAELEHHGVEAAHARLAQLDAATAGRLSVRDRQRILRALEVVLATGQPISALHARPRQRPLEARFRVLELTEEPEVLDARIEARTRCMFDSGLLEETQRVLDAGGGGALAALRAIGYDEARACLAGDCTREQAIARTTQRTRQFARRQRTWFRHQLEAPRIASGRRDASALLEAALAALGTDEPGV